MIQKAIKIRSIGMLDTVEAVGLHPITIVYGENGCGKSTLAAILRSLTTGDPRPIRAKRRFGSAEDPHASFLVSGRGRPITFDGAAWDGPGPEIEVFDRQFVDQNVHIGPNVEHGHKQALHEFVIGREGVALDERVRQLDDEIATLRAEMRDLAAEIQRRAHGDMPADEIANLRRDDDIEARIIEQERALRAAEEADRIASRPVFAAVEITTLDLDGLRALLGRSIDEVSEAAAERTRAHVETHLDEHGETWLSDGMGYVDGPTCPFCSADLTGNTLIEAFQAYFSDAYRSHREAIEAMGAAFERLFCEADAERFARRIEHNAELAAFWSTVGVDAPGDAPDVEEVKRLYASLHVALGQEVERKRSAPLEALAPTEGTLRLAEQLERVRERAAAYNEAVVRANEAIERVKREARSADVSEERRTLDRLLNQRDRYHEPLKNLCDEYSAKSAARVAKEEEKASKKEELDRYSAEWSPAIKTDSTGTSRTPAAAFASRRRRPATSAASRGSTTSSSFTARRWTPPRADPQDRRIRTSATR
ncbi:MAG TPA: AAA family ATPase [Rhodothermales bacterium]